MHCMLHLPVVYQFRSYRKLQTLVAKTPDRACCLAKRIDRPHCLWYDVLILSNRFLWIRVGNIKRTQKVCTLIVQALIRSSDGLWHCPIEELGMHSQLY